MVFNFLKRKKEDSSIDEDLSILKSSLDLTNNITNQQSLEDNASTLSLNNSQFNTNFNTNQNSLLSNNNFAEHSEIHLHKENPLLNNLNNGQTFTFLKKDENLGNFQQDKNNLNNFSNNNNYNEKEVLLKLEVIESKIEKLESKIDVIYNLLMYNKR